MIVVDVEASGTEPRKHSMVSLGALDFQNPSNRFYEECRIWDGAHIMEESLAVCGFTKEEITDKKKQTEGEMVKRFLRWIEKIDERTLAAQNVSFDRDFLKAAAERAGHTDWPLSYRTVDVHSIAYMHMLKRGQQPPVDPIKKHSSLGLDEVMTYCGLPMEPMPHNALTGALSHAEVISRLLYDRKLLPEFAQHEIPWKK